MTYDLVEASVAEGRPFFLYQFVEGANVWRFTSRPEAWVTTAGAETFTWEPVSVAHGDVVQSSEIERARLELTWPLSHPFARRFLPAIGSALVTLTIFRGHEQLPDETVAHWKGRVLGAESEGQRIVLACESVFSTLRRGGVRAKYQRLCRHPLYGRGCNLSIASFYVAASASAVSGPAVTVAAAALRASGYYAGGVLRFGTRLGFIVEHAGDLLTLSRPIPELSAAVLPAVVDIAPGCDLRAATCRDKFGNLLNFGGFPEIPGRNPFGGGSIV